MLAAARESPPAATKTQCSQKERKKVGAKEYNPSVLEATLTSPLLLEMALPSLSLCGSNGNCLDPTCSLPPTPCTLPSDSSQSIHGTHLPDHRSKHQTQAVSIKVLQQNVFIWNWERKPVPLWWKAVSCKVPAFSSHVSCCVEKASLQ